MTSTLLIAFIISLTINYVNYKNGYKSYRNPTQKTMRK